jgi:hypothetical protein
MDQIKKTLKIRLIQIATNVNLQHIYFAALVSFITTFVRDYYLIHYTKDSQSFFEIIYISSLASGFSINAIAFIASVGKVIEIFLMYLISLSILFLLFFLSSQHLISEIHTNGALLISAMITFFWIFGAYFSRKSMQFGANFFLARSRESFSSFLLVSFLTVGVGFYFSMISAIIFGTVFSFFLYKRAKNQNLNFYEKKDIMVQARYDLLFFKKILYANFAIFCMNLWAFEKSSLDIELLNYSSSSLVRVSMYIFQFLTLGSILFAIDLSLPKLKKTILISALILIISSGFILKPYGQFILFPLGIALLHYYLIGLIKKD